MQTYSRSIRALVLVVIYLLINLSSLAPLALSSEQIAHAVTGECVGDCAICGCAPEQRANRSCCCWQKKQRLQHEQEKKHGADCCKKKGCDSKPVLSCGCPCGDQKQLALFGGEKYEQLPYRFSIDPIAFDVAELTCFQLARLTGRHEDPPDPPPKPSFLS